MAIALVQSNQGTSSLATTTATFSVAPTSGNLVVLSVASDDYTSGAGAGWTESTGMGIRATLFHGAVLWWQITNGTNSFAYTIGSATVSSWTLSEWSGCSATPYDISSRQSANSSTASYTSTSLVPTTGSRLLVCAMGGSTGSGNLSTGYTSWLNSFTRVTDVGQSSGVADSTGIAYRLVTGDGVTSFSTGVTYPITVQSTSALIIAFKASAGAATSMLPLNPMQHMLNQLLAR